MIDRRDDKEIPTIDYASDPDEKTQTASGYVLILLFVTAMLGVFIFMIFEFLKAARSV